MIGWGMQAYDYLAGKERTAQPLPASLFVKDNMGLAGHRFDLFESEEHAMEWKLGDHPLQDGSTISDHVQRQLREVTVKGRFVNRPIRDKLNNKDKVEVDKIDGSSALTNKALDKFNAVVALADRREPVTLVTSLADYPQMVITSIEASRDGSSGDSIAFTMTLREVETVKLKNAVSVSTWQPDDMDTANNRMVSSEANVQQVSAETVDMDELAELYDAEALS